jgi:hypothetical protein
MTKLDFGQYVALCGKWDSAALKSFCEYLAEIDSASFWQVARLTHWEARHVMWARTQDRTRVFASLATGQKCLEILTLKVAMSAMSGKTTPIARKALASVAYQLGAAQ